MTTHIGTADLRFFGLRIYTATLSAEQNFDPVHYAQTPLALSIHYQRPLEGRLIAERSLLEMKRLGKIDSQTSAQWLDFMIQAFPNIAQGDVLSGHSDGKGLVEFKHNGTLTAQTLDTDFAARFFGIWLHESTSAPEMRSQLLASLLGLSKGQA
ncbi:MAG: hypothetical protein RLY82_1600 [Pseudomonadota bacterium]